jgi:hypothetical protein
MAPRKPKTAKKTTATCATRYYDLDDAAVIWQPGKFPKIEGGGVIYDLKRVSMSATPISKAEFEKLVASHDR